MTHPSDASANGSPTVSNASANASTDRLATVVEAAEILGITPDAVRSRLRRGTLKRSTERGEEGEVQVILPVFSRTGTNPSDDQSQTVGDQSDDQSQTVGGQSDDQSATDRDASPTVALMEALRDQIDLLTRQLDEANRANSEHRRLLAAALERIPELEASQASPEPQDGPEKASLRSDEGTTPEGSQAPEERRSWLYRFFFGP